MIAASNEEADPNLVPLLDLVLQLIMFFLMVVNFVTEQVNKAITLPVAQSARPMDKRVEGSFFINMNAKGEVIAPGEPKPLATIPQILHYLRRTHDDALRLAQHQGEKTVKAVVIIRADRNVDYVHVYQVLRMCKEVGFRQLQLRAEIQGE
jgi:biopolymer transport protein ExbD